MHYANGRAAKIGDLVRGKGYNLKHEFTGVLIGASPAATACNATIATVTAKPDYAKNRNMGSGFALPAAPKSDGTGFEAFTGNLPSVTPCTEYSQLDFLVAIDPNTGEVLPPVVA
jgi:hypothetical protein